MARVTLRPDLADLVPYDPDMRPVRVMLSANENNYGLPERLRAEIAARLADVPTNRYPLATSPELRDLLGDMWGVPGRQVVLGNGGDELIFNLLLAFAGPSRRLVTCPPTFSAYELYAQLTQTPVVRVERRDDFSVDETALLENAPGEGVIIVCSPNNPTGNLVDPSFVARLAESTDALVVVDEAYGEFACEGSGCVGLIPTHPNVAVLRTLSKAYALAGARVGYVIASDEVADGLLAVRLPYSVNRFSQVAAAAVIEGRDQVAGIVAAIVEGRSRLAEALEGLSDELSATRGARLRVYPSEANYLLVRLPEGVDANGEELPSAHEVHELLADDSILVRDFSGTPGLGGCLRVTVGTHDDHAALLDSLRRIYLPGGCPGGKAVVRTECESDSEVD